MKKLGMALPMAALLGIAASLAGCGGTSTPVDGASSGGGSSGGSGGSSGSSGSSGTAALVYGCNWLFESDAQTANVFYPDTSAVYWVAALPDSIPSGDQIEIAGTSPTARYFSFEVYTENGKAESGANDAAIFGSAATPAQAVAAGQGYKLSVIYSLTAASSGTTLVANPANVSLRAPAHKFILYRLYLPTSGAADFGNLPVLTYVAQGGTRTPLSATPDQASCNTILNNIDKLLSADGSSSSSGSGSSSSSGGLALAEPAIKPPSMSIYRSTAGRFQNLDVRYMREKTNATLGDLLLVRGKAPAFAGSGQTPQVRYWSVCSDGAHKPYPAVECLVDQDAHLGADGYYNVVISTDTPPAGYQSQFDYLPFGADAFGQPIYRQLLAAPSFSQSIDSSSILLGPKLTMGDYYPDTAYCSSSVFSGNLAAGAAAVFAACKSSQGVGIVPDLGN